MMTSDYNLIRSALRRVWLRYPERTKALLNARRESESSNKRLKWEYCCNVCGGYFKQVDVQVDHIKPCGTFLCADDWVTFGVNLFCPAEMLQVLCKPCHKVKTAKERAK